MRITVSGSGAAYGEPSDGAGLQANMPAGTSILGKGKRRNLWFNTRRSPIGWTLSCGSAGVTRDLIAGQKPDVSFDGMMLSRCLRQAPVKQYPVACSERIRWKG